MAQKFHGAPVALTALRLKLLLMGASLMHHKVQTI
jgi:hypothetical protein